MFMLYKGRPTKGFFAFYWYRMGEQNVGHSKHVTNTSTRRTCFAFNLKVVRLTTGLEIERRSLPTRTLQLEEVRSVKALSSKHNRSKRCVLSTH